MKPPLFAWSHNFVWIIVLENKRFQGVFWKSNSASGLWGSRNWRQWSSQLRSWTGGFHWLAESKWSFPEGYTLAQSPNQKFRCFSKSTPRLPHVSGGLPGTLSKALEGYIPGWVFGQHHLPLSWTDDHFKGLLSCGILVPLTLARNHEPRGIGKWKRKEKTLFINFLTSTKTNFAKAFCLG